MVEVLFGGPASLRDIAFCNEVSQSSSVRYLRGATDSIVHPIKLVEATRLDRFADALRRAFPWHYRLNGKYGKNGKNGP